MAEPTKLIERDLKTCPNCGQKLSRNGYTQSKFHAVFSDYELQLQKHRCNNLECRWQRVPTITSMFGTNIHPDLAKLQSEQGALFSYREAQSNLDKLNTYHRSVNNHSQISRLTDQVGAILSEQHLIPPAEEACAQPAKELILQMDGGHIPIQERAKRSFEALSAIVYRPESLKVVDQHHREIINFSCVLSAKDDELKTIKRYVFRLLRVKWLSLISNQSLMLVIKRVERCNGAAKGRTTFFKSGQKSSAKPGYDSGTKQYSRL